MAESDGFLEQNNRTAGEFVFVAGETSNVNQTPDMSFMHTMIIM